MVSARSVSSLAGPGRVSRRPRSSSEMDRVAAVIFRSARRIRPASSQPSISDAIAVSASTIPTAARSPCELIECARSERAVTWYSSWPIRAWARASGDCPPLGPGGAGVAGRTEPADSSHV
jgi:hypothetical protein